MTGFYQTILKTNGRRYIYGSEINFNLGTATKVNMILHGDGSTNIFVKDGLLPFAHYQKEVAPNIMNFSETDKQYNDKKVNRQFDVIITNPPFSVTLDNDTKKVWIKILFSALRKTRKTCLLNVGINCFVKMVG